MSSVLVEYPEGLPAPTVGEVRPTERRDISSVGQMRNTRAIQRDRHGTRTVAFTFTPEQAAIFREWWVEWLQLGGGWFAANWPLPWSRGPNVFRFTDPPQWQLIGGRLDGQGYWQVRATCEIRGRGMLPTAEVMYLTSTLYPIYSRDALEFSVTAAASARSIIVEVDDGVDATSFSVAANVSTRDTYHLTRIPTEAISFDVKAIATARVPITNLAIPAEAVSFDVAAAITAKVALITHTVKPDALDLNVKAEIYAY